MSRLDTIDFNISIHAPREGSDADYVGFLLPQDLFQSTLPVRGATIWGAARFAKNKFQSTLPVRGATHIPHWCPLSDEISIHAPREGSDGYQSAATVSGKISIHAPREGSDRLNLTEAMKQANFNPRSP